MRVYVGQKQSRKIGQINTNESTSHSRLIFQVKQVGNIAPGFGYKQTVQNDIELHLNFGMMVYYKHIKTLIYSNILICPMGGLGFGCLEAFVQSPSAVF